MKHVIPPLAVKKENTLDEYHWLRDPKWPNVEDPEILDYLRAENEYAACFFSDLTQEKEKIFEELKGRIKLDNVSVYTKKEHYYYYTKTEANKEYPIYCRKYGSITEGQEEVILDVNLLAQNHNFTDVATVRMHPNQTLMAYSINHSGDEKYKIKLYDLSTQKYLIDVIQEVSPTIVWHENLNGFFYVTLNENLRPDKVMFHFLGTKPEDDHLIFPVKNPLHFLSIKKSASNQYLFITSGDHNENEVYILSMQDHTFSPKLLRIAQSTIFYEIEHNDDNFYIYTNLNGKNFCIIKAPLENFSDINNWEHSYIAEDQKKYLKSFNITKNYLILNYRDHGLSLIKIKHLKNNLERIISFPDHAFEAVGYSTNFDEDDIRINYSSLTRPDTTYRYDFDNEELSILKQREIPSGFNSDEYQVERIFAENKDAEIPITLFYKKSLFKHDATNPLYLYGYGSYGMAAPMHFSNIAITLANRGFIYAIAHVRGGDELGHTWYEEAKFLNKKRTFEDFISCTELLINKKYTDKGNIAIMGGSAGGMLVGYVINERPELYKAAIAHVPFVDVLNTMLDESLPLTALEFNEWGNPKESKYFEYIKSYSPYDNVKDQNYPNLLVTCGISDARVGYWEAAKWVAKIRQKKIGDNIVLLMTDMDSGHQGSSGRFNYLKKLSDELVFIFKIFAIRI